MTWLLRFMELAEHISTWSKDPSRKIGAVIVDKNNRIISTGFNGFAKGVADTPERMQNKETKRLLMLHAEENAILHAKQDLSGCHLYVYGLPPCIHCASLIIQSGIEVVYYRMPKGEKVSEHWKENLALSESILKEAGIPLVDF